MSRYRYFKYRQAYEDKEVSKIDFIAEAHPTS